MSRPAWALVRHGETDWNQAGRLQGRTNIQLNDTGRAQAQATAEELAAHGDWDLVISSPLSRAKETARIIAAHLGTGPVLECPTLVERDYGRAEGMSIAGLDEAARTALMNGGESSEAVVRRGMTILSWFGRKYPERRLVMVGHGSFIRLVLGNVYECDYPRVENGQIAVLDPEAAGLLLPASGIR